MHVKSAGVLGIVFVALFALAGCDFLGFPGTGTVILRVTDGPLDASDVVGVFVRFAGVEYNLNGDWEQIEGFGDPVVINLMDLTGGATALLGDFELPVGQYGQIRFMLDLAAGDDDPADPPSYILRDTDGDLTTTDDQSTEALWIPSGPQTGYKAVGGFAVPWNGEVTVTADFDLRKSVTQAGDKIILKPTIRLIADGEAGAIAATISNSASYAGLVIFAYESDGFGPSEEPSVGDLTDSGFSGAVTSTPVDEDAQHTLAFLSAGAYDLVVAEYDTSGGYVGVVTIVEDVEVESGKSTSVVVDLP